MTYSVEQFSADALAIMRDGDDILHLTVCRGENDEALATDAEFAKACEALASWAATASMGGAR